MLLQTEIASEAARRAAEPAKNSFALGFLTGYEIEWLTPVMRVLRDELPKLEVAIRSKSSPELGRHSSTANSTLRFYAPNATYRFWRTKCCGQSRSSR